MRVATGQLEETWSSSVKNMSPVIQGWPKQRRQTRKHLMTNGVVSILGICRLPLKDFKIIFIWNMY